MDCVVDLFEKVEPLPTAPTILPKLLGALHDPDVDLDEVVLLVVHEPALAAKVLQLCNSAYFGFGIPTSYISEAIYRIGFYHVYRLVVAICGESSLQIARPEWGFDIRGLWKHSVITGLAAEMVAADHGEDAGALFTAGLLHDFGKLILAGAFKSEYGQLLTRAQGDAPGLVHLERTTYHVDHAELGGQLLQRWNFPPALAASVRFHHTPESIVEFERPAAIVGVADSLAHLLLDAKVPEATGKQHAYKILDFSADAQENYRDRLRPMPELIELMTRLR